MGFLLSKLFVYMLAAFLLGLFLGWLFWGRKGDDAEALRSERDRLRGDLDACARGRSDLERRLRDAESETANERARLNAEIDAAQKARAKAEAKSAAAPKTAVAAAAPVALMAAPAKKLPAVVKPAASKALVAKPAPAEPAAVKSKAATGAKPAASSATVAKPAIKAKAAPAAKPAKAKPGKPAIPDDLRKILGIGKTNEKKLHDSGVTTFAQIAAWSAADVKRIGDRINFGERIVKEKWIEQAGLLAKGDMEAFYKAFPAAKGEGNT